MFALGTDSGSYHRCTSTFNWLNYFRTSLLPGRLNLLRLNIGWDGKNWGGFEAQGGIFESSLDITSWSSNRLDVFGLGIDNAAFHKVWDGSKVHT